MAVKIDVFVFFFFLSFVFFFQAEDGIRDLVRSRGLGDVYKRQSQGHNKFGCLTELCLFADWFYSDLADLGFTWLRVGRCLGQCVSCLLYTSDAADERSSVDLGGRRLIEKKKKHDKSCRLYYSDTYQHHR